MKILLIEDNPGESRLIEEMLKEAGIQFKLGCAGSLSTGIGLIGSNGFDVILLDLGLPDSHGLETLSRLNESGHVGGWEFSIDTMKQIWTQETYNTHELRLENERLEIASRTKSEFLANMSHELRTPLKIKQVLFNLLSNAVKFSKEDGGTITIAVKKINGMVRFSVSDTGIGIEKQNFDKLFKEFQQIDSGISRKYCGTGLGLVISKKFVELHRRKLWAHSVFGEGSTFTFELPLCLN